MIRNISRLGLIFTGLIVLACANDDNPTPVNEEELITTLTITLTPQGGGTSILLTSRDVDGDGPNPPEISVSGDLVANAVYDGSVKLLNETVNPVDDITMEVADEAEEHQFFYGAGGGIDLSVDYDDQDADGNPIGLAITLTTGAASSGTLTVTLRHEPDKNGAGVKDGDITNAGGETDIAQTFDLSIQ